MKNKEQFDRTYQSIRSVFIIFLTLNLAVCVPTEKMDDSKVSFFHHIAYTDYVNHNLKIFLNSLDLYSMDYRKGGSIGDSDLGSMKYVQVLDSGPGHLEVFYVQTMGQVDRLLSATSIDRGITFSDSIVLDTRFDTPAGPVDVQKVRPPILRVDSEGTIHMWISACVSACYPSEVSGLKTLFYFSKSRQGIWTRRFFDVPDSKPHVFASAIEFTEGNEPLLIYKAGSNSSTAEFYFVTLNETDGFNGPIRISNPLTDAEYPMGFKGVDTIQSASSNGHVYVTFSQFLGAERGCFISKSMDSGMTFSLPARFDDSGFECFSPSLVVSSDDTLELFATEQHQISTRTFDGVSAELGPMESLDASGLAFFGSAIVSDDGNVHVVYSKGSTIVYSRKVSTSNVFENPQIIFEGSAGGIGNPLLLGDMLGNLHVLFTYASEGTNSIQSRISSVKNPLFEPTDGLDSSSGEFSVSVETSGWAP